MVNVFLVLTFFKKQVHYTRTKPLTEGAGLAPAPTRAVQIIHSRARNFSL